MYTFQIHFLNKRQSVEMDFPSFLKKYTNPIRLINDDWLFLKLTKSDIRKFLWPIHKRWEKSSTIFCSQHPVPRGRPVSENLYRREYYYRCNHKSFSYDLQIFDIESIDSPNISPRKNLWTKILKNSVTSSRTRQLWNSVPTTPPPRSIQNESTGLIRFLKRSNINNILL